MSTNMLTNYGMPVVEGFGQMKIAVDSTLINALDSVVTDEILDDIISSGGMTGMKYRIQAFKACGASLTTLLGQNLTTRDSITMQMKLNAVMFAIGMLLGTTSSKRTLIKTMSNTLDNRTQTDDSLDLAWRIIKESFKTYVNESNVPKSHFPSVKFCSCCPEYALLGVLVLVARKFTVAQLATELAKPFSEWPELLRKQWIGNFALSSAFQAEHMSWERVFWNSTVSSTKNESNKDFKRGFNPIFYGTTVNDVFLPVLPDGRLVIPPAGGFLKGHFAWVILVMVDAIITTKTQVYPGGFVSAGDGNIMQTAVNKAALATSGQKV